MINIFKPNREINNLLKNSNLSTKIFLYFSTKTAGDYYDSYEQNYTYTNLNPLCIKGYVRDIKAEALVWKQYGLSEIGAKEILCEEKYASRFRLCNKIEINGDAYQVYKEAQGNRLLIESRPFKLIRVIVQKVK
jgi:hypothetical protein